MNLQQKIIDQLIKIGKKSRYFSNSMIYAFMASSKEFNNKEMVEFVIDKYHEHKTDNRIIHYFIKNKNIKDISVDKMKKISSVLSPMNVKYKREYILSLDSEEVSKMLRNYLEISIFNYQDDDVIEHVCRNMSAKTADNLIENDVIVSPKLSVRKISVFLHHIMENGYMIDFKKVSKKFIDLVNETYFSGTCRKCFSDETKKCPAHQKMGMVKYVAKQCLKYYSPVIDIKCPNYKIAYDIIFFYHDLFDDNITVHANHPLVNRELNEKYQTVAMTKTDKISGSKIKIEMNLITCT